MPPNRIRISDFVKASRRYVESRTAKADRNRDGYLTVSEAKKLPKDLQDNFRSYVKGAAPSGGSRPAGPKDQTPQSRIAKHLAAYGQHRVSYPVAFQKAVAAVLTQEGDSESPRSILKEFWPGGRRPTDAQLRAELRQKLKGLELLPVGKAEEAAGQPSKDWIFRVDIDVGSDHGFWVAVNRQSGKAVVNGFN
ncbi:MAG: hypothetical protein ACOZIN_12310 [Myxococcota bacterium]